MKTSALPNDRPGRNMLFLIFGLAIFYGIPFLGERPADTIAFAKPIGGEVSYSIYPRNRYIELNTKGFLDTSRIAEFRGEIVRKTLVFKRGSVLVTNTEATEREKELWHKHFGKI